MTKIFKTAIVAAIIAAPVIVVGNASAQATGGIASVDPLIVIANSKAMKTGITQIGASYASYGPQIEAKNNEVLALVKQLDTNKDNQLSDEEEAAAVRAKSPVLTSIQSKQQEIAKLQEPILLARYFVIESVTAQYDGALKAVIAAKKLNLVLSPEAIVYATPGVNITQDVTNTLDTRLPAVPITPPANWRPTSRQTVQLHEQIMQLYQASAQQAGAQRPAAAQPAAPRPATPAPQSR
jgi:Skp family chaperone for outer membrane proteins